MNHHELVAAAVRFLRSSARGAWSSAVAASEVEWEDGRRFDVVAVEVWRSKRDVRIYEAKVSAADLRRELACGKWSSAVDAGGAPYLLLADDVKIRRADLPPGLGLARFRSGSIVHEVKVPARNPLQAPALLLATMAALRRELEPRGHQRLARLVELGEDSEPVLAAAGRGRAAGGAAARELAQVRRWRAELAERERLVREREKAVRIDEARDELLAEVEKLEAFGVQPSDIQRVVELADALVNQADGIGELLAFGNRMRARQRMIARVQGVQAG